MFMACSFDGMLIRFDIEFDCKIKIINTYQASKNENGMKDITIFKQNEILFISWIYHFSNDKKRLVMAKTDLKLSDLEILF